MSEVRNRYWNERLPKVDILAGVGDIWGAYRLTLEGHTSGVTAVAFLPDGNRIASGAWDGAIWLWDAKTGKYKQTF